MTIIKEERLKSRSETIGQGFFGVKSDILDSHKEDKNLKKVDDAKKSAIQHSRDYAEFKDLVGTCHLKPIHRNEFNAPAKLLSSNSLFNGRSLAAACPGEASKLAQTLHSQAVSKQDFYSKLGRADGKWDYVCLHPPEQIDEWFRDGMEEGVFADLVNLFDSENRRASEIIFQLSNFPWFSRATGFLSAAERSKLK